MPRKYPWPCSKIGRDLMHELHVESKNVGVPISEIIANAVAAHLNAKLEQRLAAPADPHAA